MKKKSFFQKVAQIAKDFQEWVEETFGDPELAAEIKDDLGLDPHRAVTGRRAQVGEGRAERHGAGGQGRGGGELRGEGADPAVQAAEGVGQRVAGDEGEGVGEMIEAFFVVGA